MRIDRRGWALAAVSALAVVSGVGCSGGGDDEGSALDTAGTAGQFAADEADTGSSTGGSAGAGGGSTGGSTASDSSPVAAPISVVVGEVQVVRTASLRVLVPDSDFGVAFASATQVATTLGGFVQTSSTSSYDEGDASGEVTLRVPVARFDDAVEQLGALGEVESTQVEGDDVSGELVDMAARLRSMRAEEEALNALLAEATNVNEVLTVRSTLAQVRQAIEQLAAQEASLADRAAFSTVSVVLHEGGVAASASPSDDGDRSLGDAIGTAIDVAETVVGAAIVTVGFLLPFLPLALLGWFVVLRRRRAAAPPGAPA